jgi:hypothetical protein
VGDGGWLRAVGGVRSYDLSGVDWGGTIVVVGRGSGNESCEDDGGVLHLEGCLVLFTCKVIKGDCEDEVGRLMELLRVY